MKSVITPRGLSSRNAATYADMSESHLRNMRVRDRRRIAKGEPLEGPRWLCMGTAIRYLREDLDSWLESHRADEPTRNLSSSTLASAFGAGE